MTYNSNNNSENFQDGSANQEISPSEGYLAEIENRMATMPQGKRTKPPVTASVTLAPDENIIKNDARSIPTGVDGKPLNEKEKSDFDNLRSPDEPIYKWDFKDQQMVLALLMKDKAFYDEARQYIKPEYFNDPAHGKICKIVFELTERLGILPGKQVLAMEIAERNKEHKHLTYFKGELDAAYAVPLVQSREYYVAKAKEFARFQALHMAVSRTLDKTKKGKIDYSEILPLWDEAASVGEKGNAKGRTWTELKEAAKNKPIEWIVDSILSRRSLNVLHSLPGVGKTTLLAMLMQCILQSHDWFGHKCKATNIVYLGYDPYYEERFVSNILAHWIGHDETPLERHFTEFSGAALPGELNKHSLARLLIGKEPGLVVIDTFRTAFAEKMDAGGTNDDVVITKCMKPLREYAAESGWCILVFHHNNRGSNTYSGSAAFRATTETMINLLKEEKITQRRRLEFETRGGEFVFDYVRDPRTGRFEREETKKELKELDKASEREAVRKVFAESLSLGEGQTILAEQGINVSMHYKPEERFGLAMVKKGTSNRDPALYQAV